MEEEQYGQHGLVDVTVADALVEQEAGVPHHRLQGVLPHDVVQLVCVEVLEHQLVTKLPKVCDGRAAHGAEPGAAGQVVTAVGQIQAAAAAVQADGRPALLVRHGGVRDELESLENKATRRTRLLSVQRDLSYAEPGCGVFPHSSPTTCVCVCVHCVLVRGVCYKRDSSRVWPLLQVLFLCLGGNTSVPGPR